MRTVAVLPQTLGARLARLAASNAGSRWRRRRARAPHIHIGTVYSSHQHSDALNIARRLARATLRRVRCAARALRHRPIAPLDRALIIRVIERNARPYKKTRLFF